MRESSLKLVWKAIRHTDMTWSFFRYLNLDVLLYLFIVVRCSVNNHKQVHYTWLLSGKEKGLLAALHSEKITQGIYSSTFTWIWRTYISGRVVLLFLTFVTWLPPCTEIGKYQSCKFFINKSVSCLCNAN
jgi:hypothetical protein